MSLLDVNAENRDIMTEITNSGQAVVKSKEYLVNPIGVTQAIIDDKDNYSQIGPAAEKTSSTGEVWVVKWDGYWGNDRFQPVFHIHMRRADGELMFWRNFDTSNGGAIGRQREKKYWVDG